MRTIAVLFGSLLVAIPAAAAPIEFPRRPEEVLTALETIYAAGDIEAYAAFMAPDYEFLSQQGNEIGLEQELKMLRPALENKLVTIAFSRDFRIKALAEPDTWVVRRIDVTATGKEGNSLHSVENKGTLFLRRNADTGLIQVYRWIEEPADD